MKSLSIECANLSQHDKCKGCNCFCHVESDVLKAYYTELANKLRESNKPNKG